jgi:hypothetical protein
MARAYPLIVFLLLALGSPAVSAQTRSDTGTIDIMQPERPGPVRKHKTPHGPPKSLAPAPAPPAPQGPLAGTQQHKTRRGSSNPVYPTPLPAPQGYMPPPFRQLVTPQPPALPPPIYVPETGRALPNLQAIGSGPGGAETSQDRAARCAHQAGVYGDSAGNRNAYVGNCINQ